MPATSGKAQPIYPLKVLIGGTAQAVIRRLAEKATQTFLIGTPVQVDAGTGFIQACAAIVSAATALIAGFATEPGNNLSSSGVAKTLTYGSVQNQSSAVLIPVGAPPNDGTMGFHEAVDSTIFVGVKGDGADGTLATIAQTDLGAIYGLTKDAGNNYWYIDHNITTVNGGACVQITDLIDAVGTLNGKLGFKVLHAAQQLSGN
jgi:hypothetical protein